MACLQNLLLGLRKKGTKREKGKKKDDQGEGHTDKQEQRRKREKNESIPLKPKIPSSLEAILGELHPVNSDTVDIEIGMRNIN